ncbi:MAG: hypothetical protein ACRD3E_00735 [Terriglobales bacterium]
MPAIPMRKCFLIAALCLVPAFTFGQTACDVSSFDKAIKSAHEHGVVTLAACRDTSWTAPSAPFCKSITIQGAGVGQTNLVDEIPKSNSNMISTTTGCTGKTIRISGITFRNNSPASSQRMISFSRCFGCTVRIDHNGFIGNSLNARIAYLNQTGLVDHNTIQDMGMLVDYVVAGEGRNDLGNYSWTQPISFGTPNAVYVEDNIIKWSNHQDQFDAEDGARVEYRYNTFVSEAGARTATGMAGFFDHGYDSIPRSAFEIDGHDNVIDSTEVKSDRCIQFRGGHGFIYNNICKGTVWTTAAFALTNYRSMALNLGTAGNDKGNICGDHGAPDARGYPCQDQVGRGTDSGLGTPQKLTPVYAWNNCATALGCDAAHAIVPAVVTAGYGKLTLTSVNDKGVYTYRGKRKNDALARRPLTVEGFENAANNGTFTINGNTDTSISTTNTNSVAETSPSATGTSANSLAADIQPDRDYYSQADRLDGSSGVGQGPLSERPAKCTAGVGYWVNQGDRANTLFRCSATDTWDKGIADYAYPFPGNNGPWLVADVITHDFGAQPVGSPSESLHVTIANVGGVGYTVTGVTSSSSQFTVSKNECATLPIEAKCGFEVIFRPAQEAAQSGAVTIISNAPGAPVVISVTGMGQSRSGR